MKTNSDQPVRESITVEDFNKSVRNWTFNVQNRARGRLNEATSGGESGTGKKSLRPSFKENFGEIYSTGFKFAYYLVFIHYGVGRGYIHKNGSVVRGHRPDNNKYRMYRGQPASTWKNYQADNRPVMRNGFDWLDIEIRSDLSILADKAAEYHGDKAALSILSRGKNLLIDKS